MIKFTTNKEQDPIVGYFYTGVLFFAIIVENLIGQHYFHRMLIVGARIRTSLSGLVYKKSLRLSAKARRETTVGELVNLIQVNAESFVYCTKDFDMIWSAPLQITISLVMLWFVNMFF